MPNCTPSKNKKTNGLQQNIRLQRTYLGEELVMNRFCRSTDWFSTRKPGLPDTETPAIFHFFHYTRLVKELPQEPSRRNLLSYSRSLSYEGMERKIATDRAD